MAGKVQAQKFETTNKAQIRGPVCHTRTGACTAKGRCYHGRTQRPKPRATKKSKSKPKL